MGHQTRIFIAITNPPKPKELDIADTITLNQVEQLLKEGDIKNAETLVYDFLDIKTDEVIKYIRWKYLLYDIMNRLEDIIPYKLMLLVNPDNPHQSVETYIWKHTLTWRGIHVNTIQNNISELELLIADDLNYNYQYLFSQELDWNTGYELGPLKSGSLNPINLKSIK